MSKKKGDPQDIDVIDQITDNRNPIEVSEEIDQVVEEAPVEVSPEEKKVEKQQKNIENHTKKQNAKRSGKVILTTPAGCIVEQLDKSTTVYLTDNKYKQYKIGDIVEY